MHEECNVKNDADVGDIGIAKNDEKVFIHEQIIDNGGVSSFTLHEKCVAQQVDQVFSIDAPLDSAAVRPPFIPLNHAEAAVANKRKHVEINASEGTNDSDVVAEFQPNRRKMRRNAISPNGATAGIVKDVCLLFHMDNISIQRPPSPSSLTAECSKSKRTFAAEGTEGSDAESIDAEIPDVVEKEGS
jgi:hypothetical protein